MNPIRGRKSGAALREAERRSPDWPVSSGEMQRADQEIGTPFTDPKLRPFRLPVLLLMALTLLIVFEFRSSAEDSAAAFDAANKLYEQGKFAEAAAAYHALIQNGTVSPALYFNLGNAFFKSGQVGRAIAAYRQAEQMTPRDPDMRANLQFARNQVQGPRLRASRFERGLATLSLNEWTWLSAAALWLTFGLLTARQLRPASAGSLRSWTVLAGALSLMLLACLALTWTGQSLHKTAIVTVPEATVRNGPFDESQSAFTAHDGAELRVLDRKDDWLQVTDGTRRVGWVKQDAVLVLPRSWQPVQKVAADVRRRTNAF